MCHRQLAGGRRLGSQSGLGLFQPRLECIELLFIVRAHGGNLLLKLLQLGVVGSKQRRRSDGQRNQRSGKRDGSVHGEVFPKGSVAA
jgi:hypothetical protein